MRAGRIAFYLLIGIIVLYTVFPFYWAIISSFKFGSALFKVEWWPKQLSLDNYLSVFKEEDFLKSVFNSIIVASLTTLFALVISLFSAYPLSRMTFRGRRLLLLTVLSVSMFPQIAILSGMFEVIRFFGLYNKLIGLSFCYMVFVLPFTVWILRSFMESVPKEIEEAAILDGCHPLKMIWRIFYPLMKPALVTTALLAFIAAWNEFLFALTFTLSSDKRTVPVAIAMLSGSSQFELPWGTVMAASVIVTLPLVLLVLILQRHIVSGLTAGAIKG